MGHIGPMPTRVFSKLQVMMNDIDETQRLICCFNMLVMMKKQEESTNNDT
jgi:hypothetical protein